ncbi:phytoene desaturase [Rhodovarius crocodyli]|uniref:Phytoene desaturase n=1 Tax=Rhodovarius crocodyli TaxID=1979269 RepID=A0A437MHA2_9PROT|nr:phytoene desaturase family protein [Rhodovarius crocodyli]RVT97011.1 phytoene desaturase [Rhodovarius crocodyli]
MNAPLAAPALLRPPAHVAIIGAGPGGLAAAMLLAARGLKVSVHEKDAVVGGRTRTMEAPGGYRFDLGPTFFLYPRIIREIFAQCGADLDREVEMRRLDPQYRLIFETDGAPQVLDATPDAAAMHAAIARIAPGDAAGFARFMAENRAKLAAFRPILENAILSPSDLFALPMLKALPHLRPHLSVEADLRRYFHDPRIRLAFSFQAKYLGMSPFRCPSLFTILSFLEYEHGVFHVAGGLGGVSRAMARVAERLGARIHLGCPVERVSFSGGRADGVVAGGRHIAADAVVMNADFAHAMPRLVPEARRRRWPDARIKAARYSCSTFMLYLGIEGECPGLAHHNVLMSREYTANLAQIERGEIPDTPSLYLHHPGATDPGMAPPGHSALYALAPVPNLLGGTDWQRDLPAFRETVLDRLEGLGIPDLRRRIRYERVVTPRDWQDEFAVGHGATFNLAHDFGQMLHRRPGNRFQDCEGLYLVGGGTHPGSGLPVIYEGARITSKLLLRDLGITEAAQGLTVAF